MSQKTGAATQRAEGPAAAGAGTGVTEQPAATLNVMGAGRVGQALARLLHEAGVCAVQDICNSTVASAAQAAASIGAGRPVGSVAAMRPATVWMLSVPDTRIQAVAEQLAGSLRSCRATGVTTPVAFHCSGYTTADALASLRPLGFVLASVHPNSSFADPALAVPRFPGTPCGVEGDAAALQRLVPWFERIGGVCFPVRAEDKPLYHAAAVFANNFTVVLQAIAREAWARAGVPDAVASHLQAALLKATVDNVLQHGVSALTGPAARGDDAVVRDQGAAVAAWQPQAGALYALLSTLARQLALRHTPFTPPASADTSPPSNQ